MSDALIVSVGEVDVAWREAARLCAEQVLRRPATLAGSVPVPETALDARRRQFLATRMLEQLLPIGRESKAHVLGITEVDLFIPILTFLFGQAQLGGRLALVSLSRLRPEFFGLKADPELTRARLGKEIRHELGHTLGLVHCGDPWCAMSLSNSIQQVDAKQDAYCAACGRAAEARLATLDTGERK